MIPHFEKMLYDNGALLATYAEAALATGDALFRADRARNRRMAAARNAGPNGGGFYSAYDADSEGHEGKFYVWSREEAQAALSPAEWSVFARRFGFDQAPNFEGAWHLPRVRVARADRRRNCNSIRPSRSAASTRRAPSCWRSAASACGRVSTTRSSPAGTRSRSAGWPSPRASRRAGICRGRRSRARIRARQSLLARWRGRLLATSKDGVSHLNAYLDDYAYLANALLEMLQLRWRNEDVTLAARDSRRDARALRGREARRILLHVGRSRAADPSQQELQRRCHSGRQWHCRARADSRRVPARRDALARGRGTHAARRAGWRSIAFRMAT